MMNELAMFFLAEPLYHFNIPLISLSYRLMQVNHG